MKWKRTNNGDYVSGEWVIVREYKDWNLHYGEGQVYIATKRKLADAKKLAESGAKDLIAKAEKHNRMALAAQTIENCRELDRNRRWKNWERLVGCTPEEIKRANEIGEVREAAVTFIDRLHDAHDGSYDLEGVCGKLLEDMIDCGYGYEKVFQNIDGFVAEGLDAASDEETLEQYERVTEIFHKKIGGKLDIVSEATRLARLLEKLPRERMHEARTACRCLMGTFEGIGISEESLTAA